MLRPQPTVPPIVAAEPPPPAALPPVPPPWRALLPTRWLVLGLSLVLALRLTAWIARRIWVPELPAVREVVKGLAWDVALVLAAFALARALAGLRRQPGPVAILARAGQATLALVAGLAVVVRWFDLAHCYMAKAHWTADAFLYLDGGFAGSVADPRLALALLAMAGTAALLPLALHRDARLVAPPLLASGRLSWLLVAAALTLPPAGWALRDGIVYPAQCHQARLVPEVNFVRQWLVATAAPRQDAEVPKLPEETWRRFVALGLVPPGADRNAPFPLVQDHLDRTPFPHPVRPGRETLRPNVVLTFMESVNSLFVHALSGRYHGLMPEVSALVDKMTSVDRFYNTASPTIAALVTALCSVHPAAHPYDLRVGQSVDGKAAYTCIADLLRQHGYRTVFVQGAQKTVTSKEYFLRTHGFEEVWGREDLQPMYPGRPMGPWGPHDDTLVEFVQKTIARLEALRAQDGRPYLLVMLTLDSHEPGMQAEDCTLPVGPDGQVAVANVPPDPAAHKLLAGYHCSDKALGQLGRFLLDQPRRDDTTWLLTADHASFFGLVPKDIYVDRDDMALFGHIPLLVHDPVHELPRKIDTLAGTRDITPTILHMLGITEATHSLTGYSLFGRRRDFQFLVGRIGERMAHARTVKGAIEQPIGYLRDQCAAGRTLLQANGVDFTACDLVAWLDWQDGLWAARALFPKVLYRGSDGVDADQLDRQMERNRAEQAVQAGRAHQLQLGALAMPAAATAARAPVP